MCPIIFFPRKTFINDGSWSPLNPIVQSYTAFTVNNMTHWNKIILSHGQNKWNFCQYLNLCWNGTTSLTSLWRFWAQNLLRSFNLSWSWFHWVFQHGTYHKVKTCSHIKICYIIATCDTSWSNVSSWWTLTFHPGVHIYSILYGFSITTRNQTCCQYFSSSALIGLSKVHQHNEITQ